MIVLLDGHALPDLSDQPRRDHLELVVAHRGQGRRQNRTTARRYSVRAEKVEHPSRELLRRADVRQVRGRQLDKARASNA